MSKHLEQEFASVLAQVRPTFGSGFLLLLRLGRLAGLVLRLCERVLQQPAPLVERLLGLLRLRIGHLEHLAPLLSALATQLVAEVVVGLAEGAGEGDLVEDDQHQQNQQRDHDRR